ncbi:hypothetical protein CI610_03265 [invertebrate metagenome]|uniref:Uncharacterized protein n=1 Tax=invertebrate metagenome TaxID=1711999 RepID=A0A2H9T3M2_9ZZZZ
MAHGPTHSGVGDFGRCSKSMCTLRQPTITSYVLHLSDCILLGERKFGLAHFTCDILLFRMRGSQPYSNRG